MTLLFEVPYQNGNGKGIGAGGIRSAVKLVKPLFNECLNERIIHYSKKNNKSEVKSNKMKEKTIEGKKNKSKQSENKKTKKCKTCSKKSGKCNKACAKIKSRTKKDFLD